MTTDLVFPCLACLVIGFLGGFAFGFRIAASLRLDQQHKQAKCTNLLNSLETL